MTQILICSSFIVRPAVEYANQSLTVPGSKEAVPDVSHARDDHTILGKTIVNHSDRYLNVRMGLYQGFQPGLAGNAGDNMDFRNAPLLL